MHRQHHQLAHVRAARLRRDSDAGKFARPRYAPRISASRPALVNTIHPSTVLACIPLWDEIANAAEEALHGVTTRLYFLLGCPLTLLVLTGGSACVTEVLEDESIVFSLAHGRDCVFACNVAQPGERGYQRSGEQPSCFAGALTMSHACTPIVD